MGGVPEAGWLAGLVWCPRSDRQFALVSPYFPSSVFYLDRSLLPSPVRLRHPTGPPDSGRFHCHRGWIWMDLLDWVAARVCVSRLLPRPLSLSAVLVKPNPRSWPPVLPALGSPRRGCEARWGTTYLPLCRSVPRPGSSCIHSLVPQFPPSSAADPASLERPGT